MRNSLCIIIIIIIITSDGSSAQTANMKTLILRSKTVDCRDELWEYARHLTVISKFLDTIHRMKT